MVMTWHVLEVDGPVGTTPVVARLAEDPQRRILLVRTADGVLHGTDPGCPHLGQPLWMGSVNGEVLECDHHGYRYRLHDGVCVRPGGPLAGTLPLHDVRDGPEGFAVRLPAAAS